MSHHFQYVSIRNIYYSLEHKINVFKVKTNNFFVNWIQKLLALLYKIKKKGLQHNIKFCKISL